MPRRKKDAKILHMKLNRQLYELLEARAQTTGKTKTELVEDILSGQLLKVQGALISTDSTCTDLENREG